MSLAFRCCFLKGNQYRNVVLRYRSGCRLVTQSVFDSVFSYIGTSIAYLGAEVATTVSMYFIGRKYIPIIYFKNRISLMRWVAL